MTIALEKSQRDVLIGELQNYMEMELDRALGQFEAEFLLDFIVEKLGPHFYNQGIYDAQASVSKQMDNLVESFYQLEK
ncbi:MAG: DUF2164 domain-containing protein [Gammaproteobacteria bacterium]|jgi:uncharacterized protein (DUF2164 family)|nr:DUF2164 domain-containing protein [Gammaproteobacteria bacterium]MCP4880115.1 DUF2164 domain-containing protein [Gammaproteobacteria bacterium]MDP6164709.1 DUF2164 domain-containing protein [Gammaproteobacteria bacterium]